MRINQLLALSPEEMEDLSDVELDKYFKPCLKYTQPSLLKLPSKGKNEVTKVPKKRVKQQELEMTDVDTLMKTMMKKVGR